MLSRLLLLPSQMVTKTHLRVLREALIVEEAPLYLCMYSDVVTFKRCYSLLGTNEDTYEIQVLAPLRNIYNYFIYILVAGQTDTLVSWALPTKSVSAPLCCSPN